MDELDLFFEEEELIEIASNQLQSADKAPAIVSVISGSEIRKSGARTIHDVLRRVPGFGTSLHFYGKKMIEVRGIKTEHSEKVKLLIDGHSANGVIYNSFTWNLDNLSVDNIKRIEIIRGPGSALHGSNAFVGVINIVTKNAEDIDGLIVTASMGNFDTKKINVQAGKRFDKLEVSYFIDAFETDGPQRTISPDIIGNSGLSDLSGQKLDTGLKLKYSDFSWNTRYANYNRDIYIGIISALGDENDIDTNSLFSELSYTHNIDDNMTVSAKGYIDSEWRDNYFEIYPKGYPPFLGTPWYDDGFIGNPSGKSRILGSEIQLDYKTVNNHLLTLGARAETHKLYDTKHLTNFDPVTGAPQASVQDNSANGNWIDEVNAHRNIIAVYLQDIWSVTETMDMTLGVRHDNYSDFGGTTNPRAALVWQVLEDWDIKALYGTAFRSPTFAEQYIANNPTIKGNDDLKPETIQTTELSLGFKKDNLQARTTYFNNSLKDKILPVASPGTTQREYQNKGGADVQGVELEGEWKWQDIARLYANYTHQDAEDSETGNALADVAKQKANVGVDVSLGRYLDVNLNLFATRSRPRADGDTRGPVPGHKLVDMTVIGKSFVPGLELRASIFNLLDEDYVDPSSLGGVINDHPRAGRSFMLDITYRI